VQHTPVLLAEALNTLDPKKGETVLDVTVGLGGHAAAFLERIGKSGKLIGLDADEKNLEEAGKNLSGKNVALFHSNFRNLATCFDSARLRARSAQHDVQHDVKFDIIFADLGLSSPHLDDPARGFSFRTAGPLDCRYDQAQGMSATELIKNAREEELTKILREYGELPQAQNLARAIKKGVPETTDALAKIAEEVYGFRAKKLLPQIFQGLRIAVNDELGALAEFLQEGPVLLNPGGRMGVISYHSLEDRMVKRRFAELTAENGDAPATFELLTKKAIQPTMGEVRENPRARSARFRVLKKS
jgi:16S rRNA (cytosine1402-N4)-methyltransferase